ncbi:hypothetical protein B0H17DRAFT_1185983 [Mycena rosella]|uniref:DUF6535 domain-containing protein n=1 Tax=Mycena rosella TaxID=1033263 RepID=A0AAD7CP43_MYCRO|nr:hypothetical protein B0H17DRAFT_1185983 [Mycena rosella]
MSSEGGELNHHSPHGQRVFGLVWRWFRAISRQNVEYTSNVSSRHAQTEDAASKFWSIYITEAERYDSALVESWKADMEGMLIFSGLFSASLTAFIIESYKNLIPDTGNMTVALLSQVSQQLSAQFNGSHLSIPSPIPFEVQTSSLICNGFWFVSLGLSLTCALLATLVEQWAREFLHKTEIRPSPVRRARVFSFLYYGISRFGIHAIVDIIPLLLHIALVLFFAGLAAFLLPINFAMTTIVSGILVVFLAFYTVITILPVVSLDCPYRTPLSAIFWRFVQYFALIFNLPSTNRSLTDAVLAAAMQRRDIRDERAVLWTLESLTDNTELLPFVETVHDIIYAPTGFRRVDDHLFRLVLQTTDSHTSLPSRILAFLWSAETLSPDDPLRNRRQVEGLRALWSLAFVASRISMLPMKEVYWINYTSLQPLTIPREYKLALYSVIDYTYLKNIRQRLEEIGTMLSLGAISTARERRRMIRCLRATVPSLDADVTVQQRGLRAEISSSLHILGRIATSDPDGPTSYDDFAVARRVIGDLTRRDQLWQFHFARNVVELLNSSFNEGLAPYNLLATCEEILPEVPTWPDGWQSMDVFSQALGPHAQNRPASLHVLLRDSSQNDLDVLMRCSLRLLPLLAPLCFVPTIHWYLAHRSRGVDAFEYAFTDCNWDTLSTSILDDMRSPSRISDDTLLGIATLCLWRHRSARLLDLRSVLSIIEATPQVHSSPGYPTLKAILLSSMLTLLAETVRGYMVSERSAQDIAGLLQGFAIHPLLHEAYKSFMKRQGAPPAMTETLDRIVEEISDQYAATFILFLSACTSAAQLPYKADDTITYLCLKWDLYTMRVKAGRQLEFAQAVLHLVEWACDVDNPRRAEVESVVHALWENLDDEKILVVSDPPSAAIFVQARALYQDPSGAKYPGLLGQSEGVHVGAPTASVTLSVDGVSG